MDGEILQEQHFSSILYFVTKQNPLKINDSFGFKWYLESGVGRKSKNRVDSGYYPTGEKDIGVGPLNGRNA